MSMRSVPNGATAAPKRFPFVGAGLVMVVRRTPVSPKHFPSSTAQIIKKKTLTTDRITLFAFITLLQCLVKLLGSCTALPRFSHVIKAQSELERGQKSCANRPKSSGRDLSAAEAARASAVSLEAVENSSYRGNERLSRRAPSS